MGFRVAVSPLDFRDEQYVLCDDRFVFTITPFEGFPQGIMGFSIIQREWAVWSVDQEITVGPYDPFTSGKQAYLSSLTLEADFASKARIMDEPYDQDDLAQAFIKVSTSSLRTIYTRLHLHSLTNMPSRTSKTTSAPPGKKS